MFYAILSLNSSFMEPLLNVISNRTAVLDHWGKKCLDGKSNPLDLLDHKTIIRAVLCPPLINILSIVLVEHNLLGW